MIPRPKAVRPGPVPPNLDAALTVVRAIARERGWCAVTIQVQADGRVGIWAEDPQGRVRWRVDCDVAFPEPLPSPEQAFRALVKP